MTNEQQIAFGALQERFQDSEFTLQVAASCIAPRLVLELMNKKQIVMSQSGLYRLNSKEPLDTVSSGM